MKIISFLLLFPLIAFAQYPKSEFYKTLDSINDILYQTKIVRYIDKDNKAFYLRKINANEKGDILLIDTLSSDQKKNRHLIFNLLDIKKFIINGNKIQLINQKNLKVGTITNVEIQYMKPIIKELENLTFLTKNKEPELTKQEAIAYIKSYYSDFYTSSDQYSNDYGITREGYEREDRKITANYKVEINNCNFKMTFDTYKWPYDELKGTRVIEFNFTEIDSITEGPSEVRDDMQHPGFLIDINWNILFNFKKNKNATIVSKYENEELQENVQQMELKIYKFTEFYNFYEDKIVKAFERLRKLCLN
jgi:hypothetical protein